MSAPGFVEKRPFSEAGRYLRRKQENPEHERWIKGQLVWLKQKGPVYRPAKVKRGFDKGAEKGGIVMYKEKGKVKNVRLSEEQTSKIFPMGKENLQCYSHFSPDTLTDISEPALFHNIRMRFEMGYSFQTLCDNILLFLNHQYETDVPTLSALSDLGDDQFGEQLEIHPTDIDPLACTENLSSVVSRAFHRLVESGGKSSQSIVINGCEGSGKRDVTRFVLLRAIQLSRPKNANWWQKLLAGDLLLQEFGGENGYVRWTELQLFFGKDKKMVGGWLGGGKGKKSNGDASGSNAQLLGAVCNAFGLEQSRVTEGELFPAFVSLVAHAKLKPEEFNYMRRPGLQGSLAQQTQGWDKILESMEILGLSEDLRSGLEQMLIGILDTGNIEFADVQDLDDEDEARRRQEELENQMGDGNKNVLGVRLQDLRNALKIKTIHVKHETFEKERTHKEKYAVRDGLARVIYAALFDWIIDTVNKEVSRIDDVLQSAMAMAQASSSTHEDVEEESSSSKGKKDGTQRRASKVKSGTMALFSRKNSKRESQMNLQKTKTKGVIGIIGVLENAALVRKESTLEDLYHNYRLERFQEFFHYDIAEKNSQFLTRRGLGKNTTITYSAGNELMMRLFMGSVHKDVSRIVASQKKPDGAQSAVQKARQRLSARYQPNKGSEDGESGTGGGGLGLLQQIEEEIYLPGGNDKGLARKIVRKAKVNRALTNATNSDFTISHFGGPVTYNLEGFVDRSRANIIPMQVLKLLKERSTNPLVRQVVGFRRDPIGESGVMAKRELQSMLELDNKAVEEAALAAMDPSEAAHERIGHAETAKRIFNEMNRAMTILTRTQVEFIFSLGSNPEGNPEKRLDSNFLLDQLQQLGLTDAISRRLYDAVRGTGIPSEDFVRRYSPILARNPPTGAAASVLCSKLAQRNLISGQYSLSEDQTRVYVNAPSFFALETALRLVQNEAASCIQRMVRSALHGTPQSPLLGRDDSDSEAEDLEDE